MHFPILTPITKEKQNDEELSKQINPTYDIIIQLLVKKNKDYNIIQYCNKEIALHNTIFYLYTLFFNIGNYGH